MSRYAALAFLFACGSLFAQDPPAPIIDVHLHALKLADFPMAGTPPIPHCVPMTDYPVPESGPRFAEIVRSRDLPCHATWSPKTDDEVMHKTIEIMKRRNVFGVLSGGEVLRWMEAAPGRFIPSHGFTGGPDAPTIDSLRQQFKAGRFVVLGEVTTQYGGLRPDDASLASLWALADELQVPVGIHIGTGPVGAPYVGFDRYRARLHSPLTLEEVLIRHPKLRIYIMHAGWPMIDDLLALLWTHPHVYVDTGAIAWILPPAEFHRYLQRIVEAGFAKRILFGSDQMIWPETLELAIQSIESAAFLSGEQRRDIYFNNAARFLRLTPERIAEMQGKAPD